MKNLLFRKCAGLVSGITLLATLAGCTQSATVRGTTRDKTAKGAGIGALSGAALSVVLGKRKADQILIGAAIGAGIGAGVGGYMDAQEEKLARIPGTTVERVDKETLLVNFDSDILFATDSSSLTSASRSTLGEVASVITEYGKTAVVIQGHTDSTGTEAHNQALSERRAGAVQGFLEGQGVNHSRMASTGFGEGAPVASNMTIDGRSQNRRVNILLKAKAV